MYIKVSLFNGIKEPLFYKAPDSWQSLQIGTIVIVPLRAKKEYGYIVELVPEKPNLPFTIKEALSLVDFPSDARYFEFLKILCEYHHISVVTVLQRIKNFLRDKKQTEVEQPVDTFHTSSTVVTLTTEQQTIVDYLAPAITEGLYTPTLIHGVTGSGKTEVYKKLFTQALDENKSVIFLVPEVTLAVQFKNLFKKIFKDQYSIVSFHCATSQKDKNLLWNNILANKPQLIMGVHLPILLPLNNLGLIIIDEEHETGFQEKKHPRINSKEAAIIRAQHYNIPIVLGSATPCVTSLYNIHHRNWKLFPITQRFKGAFPQIKMVCLLDKKERKNFWISTELYKAIQKQLLDKKQTIIFINRRGISFFVQCKECSFVFSCTDCSVSLTLHDGNILRCHYCNHVEKQPERCPKCTVGEFLKKGIGTQQIAQTLQKLFPNAHIGRADLDATVNKKIWQKTITAFENQELDILVGTQTITKGYDFPHVTLVGIIWADIDLNFPFYNAHETALQKIIQVAGRAGRHSNTSSVIIQTFSSHDIFAYINEEHYRDFYQHEIEQRKELSYPPFGRLAEITIKHTNQERVDTESDSIAQQLRQHSDITVLGPTTPPIAKVKKIFSKKIFIKSDSFTAISKAYRTLALGHFKCTLHFTPNPLS